MGRGTSAGGGKSSLGYLFGGGEAPAPQPPPNKPTTEPASKNTDEVKPSTEPASKNPNEVKPTTEPASKNPTVYKNDQTPPSTTYATNNYHRTDGQNCGNFITDRPSTKVHAAPGGGSSLDYLFGDGKKK